MARYSLIYHGSELIEVGLAGEVWASPEAMKAFTVREVTLSADQFQAMKEVSKGAGGDGLTKTARVLFMEQIAASKPMLDALISAASAEAAKALPVSGGKG